MMVDQRMAQHSHSQRSTILVVEDDPGSSEFLLHAFRTATAYHLVLASDGWQTLALIETLSPDLVLLDYHLPGLDGLTVADRLRERENLKGMPIVLMSAEIPRQEVEKRQLAWITKPLRLDTLFQMIEELLAGFSPSSRQADGCALHVPIPFSGAFSLRSRPLTEGEALREPP